MSEPQKKVKKFKRKSTKIEGVRDPKALRMMCDAIERRIAPAMKAWHKEQRLKQIAAAREAELAMLRMLEHNDA